jgi:hypothetical protein
MSSRHLLPGSSVRQAPSKLIAGSRDKPRDDKERRSTKGGQQMTIQDLKPITAASASVGEFFTEARLEALNAALAAHGVDANRIISIFEMPGRSVANAVPPRYHVLYRKA